VAIVLRRIERFTRLVALCKASILKRRQALQDDQASIVENARLVLSTLANSYLSPVMKDARFDVVIAEEASMAILPALFYAASLGREKIIVVGDPRQLPAILHSKAQSVYQVMGRSVFDVGVTDPMTSDIVAMLEIQYRMHPRIGDLVSRLFYDGRLRTRGDTARHDEIADGEPYRGASVVVLDTSALTTCRRAPDGSSRVNPETAQISVQLAVEAAHGGTRSVAVITPYHAQARLIRTLLATRGRASIECSTIHRFQGHESDVVIFDTVDAAPMAPGMLLSGDGPASVARNLLNVSISRARGKLIIIADAGYFEKNLPRGIVAELLRKAATIGTRVSYRS
jgi:superfamily I DNA and/or RNA helicase